ncbi:MAG: hypothetical protein V1708_05265, partial [Candidatus Micrarchaeota archaeon]
MAREGSMGECLFCGGAFEKNAVSRHLEKCPRRRQPSAGSQAKFFHILVEGSGAPWYWMRLAARESATLKDLDGFLREEWLECCGHLSEFKIEGMRYSIDAEDGDCQDMSRKLSQVLAQGLKFTHEYDFGTTTELSLKVAGDEAGEKGGKPVRLLAKNKPPDIRCSPCGKPATQVCAQCIYEGKGWLCSKCGKGHECGEETLLPLVNSPRVGMCGYT